MSDRCRRVKEWFHNCKNWFRNYIFSNPKAFFILGLVFSHSFAEYAAVSFLIVYLTDNWKKQDLPKAVAIINIQDGVKTVLAVVLAHVADSCMGRFKVVLSTTLAYILGLMLLCCSAMYLSPIGKIDVFYAAAVILVVGMAGQEPPLRAFLADQLSDENATEEKQKEIDDRTNILWRVARFSGATIALVSLPNAKWEIAFGVSALVMGANLMIFLFGCCLSSYKSHKPNGSFYGIILRVLMAAIHNLNSNYPHTENRFYWENCEPQPGLIENSHGQIYLLPKVLCLRWLDKAAVIDEGTPPVSPKEQELLWHLCTAEQVMEVKRLFTLIPIWTSFLGCSLVAATGNTFFYEQASNMDVHIANNIEVPLNVLFALKSIICYIISFMFSFKKARQHVTQIRIGVGMICSALFCFVAWQVEVHRLYLIEKENISPIDPNNINPSDPNRTISMSVVWLIPQFILLGLMEGLAIHGLQEFFYNHVAISMRSHGPSFSDCVLGLGNFISVPFVLLCRSWFKDSINTSHLDRYYLTLAILSFMCLVLYACSSYSLNHLHMGNASEDEGLNEIVVHGIDDSTESQPTRSVCFPIRRRNVANAAAATATESQPTKSFSFPLRSISLRLKDKKVGESAANVDFPEHMEGPLLQSQPTRSVRFPIRRRNVANAAAATATESQPNKSVSFPLRSISLRLKDKKVGESAANVDFPEHMEEPLLQSRASTEAEEGLPPDDKPESHHD